MRNPRNFRRPVRLGIRDLSVVEGDHLALFYDNDKDFANALGFVELGLRGNEHGILFGLPPDTDRMLSVLRERGWDVEGLLKEEQVSVLRPEPTCEATVSAVSSHFEKLLGQGTTFIRFLGNAAVGREGWPSDAEFYKLEATVSAATLNLPCVAICMFDLRTQSAETILKAAFEGHPVTINGNCIRENPLYIPKSARA